MTGKKRKRDLLDSTALILPPDFERAIIINLSAQLRAFYTALAKGESERRGYVVTVDDLRREMKIK